MTVRIIDLQLIYGVEGARAHFERLCAQLIRSKFLEAKGVRVQNGDGGVDSYAGEWTESGSVHVFQVKFFPAGLGDDQKKQIRESFKTCLANPRFTTVKWTLCLPVDLSKDEISWFNNWKNDVDKGTLTNTDINWWGETELEELLFESKNEGIKNAFFQEKHLTQIREIHGMLRMLVNDVVFRLGGPPKETIDSSLVNYFQHNVDVAYNIFYSIKVKREPPINRFDTVSWTGLTSYALSTYSTPLYMLMADAVRLLSQGNNQIEAIWNIHTSNRNPIGGIDFNIPSIYTFNAMRDLELLILGIIQPKLSEVLNHLDKS